MPRHPPTSRARLRPTCRDAVSLTLVIVAAALGGCRPAADVRPDDIRSYVVPKGAEPVLVAAAPAAAPSTGAVAGAPGKAPLRYEVPDGWTDGGASGMRLATLLIGDPADKREVTVIPASGTLESNVARWQKQLDPDADTAAVNAASSAAIAAADTIDVDGTPATVVLLRGGADDGEAILGAMLPVENAAALFVKFRGPAEVALSERERFSRFVSSIRWKE